MQNGSNAFGDMSNTINSLQNQIRIFQASLANFKLAIGDLIQEPVRKALVYLNGFIIGITNVIRAIKPINTTSKTGENQISELGADAEETEQELKGLNGQLATFDKFNVLGGQKDGLGGGEMDITKALTIELQKQQEIYKERLKTMQQVSNQATKIAENIKKWFIETDAEGKFKNFTLQAKALFAIIGTLVSMQVVKLIGKTIIAMKALSGTTGVLTLGISMLIGNIVKLISSWGDMSGAEKVRTVFTTIASAALVAATAVAAFHGAWTAGTAAIAITAGLTAIAGAFQAFKHEIGTVEGFANGGITNANLIMTNENGLREWVGRQGNSTAVVNDTQMSDVMRAAVAQGTYDALYAINQTGGANSTQPINVYIDSDKVFTATRKAAKRQGLDFSRV